MKHPNVYIVLLLLVGMGIADSIANTYVEHDRLKQKK